jgi:hypothetical protein
MRKSELKVGGEYAAGSSSKYDQWWLVPVRVVEIDGERPRRNGTMQRGIVVQLLQDSTQYRWRGKAGDEKVIDSARDLQCEWAPYVERKAEHARIVAERQAEAERVRKVAEDVEVRLTGLGFGRISRSDGTFRIPADTMAKIVALIPDPVSSWERHGDYS